MGRIILSNRNGLAINKKIPKGEVTGVSVLSLNCRFLFRTYVFYISWVLFLLFIQMIRLL